MNKENIRDYNYLALELTKIRYQKDNLSSTIIIDNETILSTFNYYLEQLLSINNNADFLTELQEENETLKLALQKIEEELNNPNVIDKKKEKLITTINANRGNMEPWLATELINIINTE